MGRHWAGAQVLSLAFLGSGCWGRRGHRGGFFSIRRKKNQSAFSSAAHTRAGCKKRVLCRQKHRSCYSNCRARRHPASATLRCPKIRHSRESGGGRAKGLVGTTLSSHGCSTLCSHPTAVSPWVLTSTWFQVIKIPFSRSATRDGLAEHDLIPASPPHAPACGGTGMRDRDAVPGMRDRDAAGRADARIKPSCAATSLLFKSVSAWFPALCHPASVKAHGFPWCCSLQYLMTGGRAVLRNTSVLPCEQKVASRGQSRQEKPLAVNFSRFCSN